MNPRYRHPSCDRSLAMSATRTDSPTIAVVGMAARLPGAGNTAQFWRNVSGGTESVIRYTDKQLIAAGEDPALLADPNYVRAGAPLDGVDMFDAGFFGFSARDAAILDPQHRQFLEVCWEALEDAGHVPESFPGAIGVFAGAGMHDYYVHHLAPNRTLMQEVGPFLVRHTGNDKDFLTTRASYCLNLTGPSIGVQTACSTSLVAIHMAVQSLLNGECDLALAGGVSITLPDRLGYLHREGEILSPDGHCRAFDSDARGTIFGSGVGVVVLRRSAEAAADRDHVYAVIRGSAVNNDGRGKVSYLAPSLDGQARCIAEALAVAAVPPSSIGYVEAHGTGTPMGDPIEVAALTEAFGADAARQRCAIGSVKTNVGHLDTAAGVASFIKAALALQHRLIPPSLNFAAANPACHFEHSPFRVTTSATPWVRGDTPRRASVNSLGVGGTNAHVVLEEAPDPDVDSAAADVPQLLCLSARSPDALNESARRLAAFLRAHPQTALADVAHTLRVGRRAFPYRRTVVASSLADAANRLEALRGSADPPAPAAPPPVVFMFPGGGAQYPNMARQLYVNEPVFREHVDAVLAIVEADEGLHLRQWLFPGPGDEDLAATELERASHSLLSTFAVEYAMAQWWRSRGIEPAALIGHSLGELAAACFAGVMTLRDALAVVAARGRILDRLPGGATLAVGLSEDEMLPYLGTGLSIAAVNGPAQCVVSGSLEDVAALESILVTRDIDARRLRLSFAAHSSLLDGHLDGFAREIASVPLRAPLYPLISNASGRWGDADFTRSDYWVRQLRHTVRFSEGLSRAIHDHPGCVLLDVGPGTTLANLATQRRDGAKPSAVVASLKHPQHAAPEAEVLLNAVGQLWAVGVGIDWPRLGLGARRRVPLPTYPFEHKRYWIDRPVAAAPPAPQQPPVPDARLARLPSIDDWFSTPTWRPVEMTSPLATVGACLVLDDDDDPLHEAVRQALSSRGDRIIRATPGTCFGVAPDGRFMVRPGVRADWDRLVADIASQNLRLSRVVHLWTCPTSKAPAPLDAAIDAAFYSLLFLAQAWAEAEPDKRLHIAVVSSGMQRVGLESLAQPERALALGPCLVIPKEYPAITCASIDWSADWHAAGALARLVGEICAAAAEPVVALRDEARFVPASRPLALPMARPAGVVRPGGVYLVTGGLGAVGLALAEALARTPGVTIALLTRRAFPAQTEWATWTGRQGSADDTPAIIERLTALTRHGAAVEVLTCDVSDEQATRAAVTGVRQRFGTLNGVIHAAGVLDDGPFQLKERHAAHAVIAAKVHGTLALEQAVSGLTLDFFVMCSSTSTVLAPAGQIDYVAANAFLEAFAVARSGTPLNPTAIAWGTWAEAGMAFRAAQSTTASQKASPIRHPLLGRLVEDEPARVYQARYDVGELWVLDQHRLADGTAVLPGSGFVELFRAAATDGGASGLVELRDLHLLAPLHAAPGRPLDVRTFFEPQADGVEMVVTSRVGDGWVEHARATIVASAVAPGPRVAIDAISARCGVASSSDHRPKALQDHHLRLGPRWQALRALLLGDAEALAWCELPAGFDGDLADWSAHPALVDLALHAGLPLVPLDVVRGDLFVPISMAAVRFEQPVPARFVSHVRLVRAVRPDAEVISFDVTIASEDGSVVMAVDDLVLRRLDHRARAAWTASLPRAERDNRSKLAQLVDLGIRRNEGAEVLLRVLSGAAPPCLVASPIDLATVEAVAQPSRSHRPDAVSPRAAAAESAPRDQYERALCEIWSDLLGVDGVGIHDDFFALGGHSLVAVRLFTRVRKLFGVSLGLAVLFEAPTVAACAALLRKDLGAATAEFTAPVPPAPVAAPTAGVGLPMDVIRRSPCLVPIQPHGTKRPFFVLPGVGGNVLGYHALTESLPSDQPVIAMQSLGVDGSHQPLLSMQEIAAHFIVELRSVQPAGPYLLGGFSFGGIVGLEMAQQLLAAGERVELLALFDTLLDSTDFTKSSRSARWSRWFEFTRRRVVHHWRALLAVEPRLLPGYLAGKRRTMQRRIKSRVWREVFAIQEAVPHQDDDGSVDLMPSLRHVRDANVLATKRYVPVPYRGVVTLFRAMERGLEPVSSDANWRHLAAAGLTVVDVPGNHLTMLEAPNVWVLGSALDEAIDRAQRRIRQNDDDFIGRGAAEPVFPDR
jgi:acyl transferase domain-containing protein/thioesterase domain-containing protein